MAVAAVGNHCLTFALLEEGKRFAMGALPCRKYPLSTWQACQSDVWEKAWAQIWGFSRDLVIHLT